MTDFIDNSEDKCIQYDKITFPKKRVTCKSYCWLWNSDDKDCEMYGENHPRPKECPYFKFKYAGLYRELFEEKKNV